MGVDGARVHSSAEAASLRSCQQARPFTAAALKLYLAGLCPIPWGGGLMNTTSGNSITKSASVRPVVASFAQPFLCVRADLMAYRPLPGRQVPVIFRVARDCAADRTAAAVGKRHAADHCLLVCFSAPTRRQTPRLHAKETHP